MPNACAIRLKDRWLIFPELKSISGFFVASEPYQSLPTDAEAFLLGRAVRNAFGFAQRQIPDPTDWKAFPGPRLAAAQPTELRLKNRSKCLVAGVTMYRT